MQTLSGHKEMQEKNRRSVVEKPRILKALSFLMSTISRDASAVPAYETH